ncbi:ribonuclease III [Alkaliphilus oremlandii]|uniref:Ribonuclease 3 n=1 Tax=Alkaliphilus oremlandii (strain OhILAs) TaxID=350688 RepID=A8MHB5_ALKOO|nr:ribonuclease III [Alkaliphilus oremlandii]ABW19002.1 Ribonuclease III [Alkaliphilus oremlandii OhILAs]
MKLEYNRMEQIKEFQKIIGYQFKNLSIINEALTHSSYTNEYRKKQVQNNERLEFLGDSVLGIVVSEYIYLKYKDLPEGELTKIRANVVCEPSLGNQAKEIKLGQYLLLGKGEEATGGRDRVSILADAFEAVIGALYLDGGIAVAGKFILDMLTRSIELAIEGNLFRDYKTDLQEILQSKYDEKISYKVVSEVGPDHNKTFEVEILLGEKSLGMGEGKSKKEAEQRAAKSALKKVELEHGKR